MARKRPAWRIKAQDGLDQIIELTPPFSMKDLPPQLLVQLGADPRQFWRKIAAGLTIARDQAKPFSLEAYALDIVELLDTVSSFERDYPQHAWVVTFAMWAGAKMSDAQWRLMRGPHTRSGKKQHAKAPRAGKLSGEARSQQQRVRRDQVEVEARRLRAIHPRADKVSTRQLAIRISYALGFKFNTVYQDLRTLKIT